MDLDVTPCPSTLDLGLVNLVRLRAALSRSVAGLVYMPRSWTPVVSQSGRCQVLSETLSLAVQQGTLTDFDAAFASSYWLGHHGNGCLSGLDPFTLAALRPAHSLSTLRPAPRGTERKTRYNDLSVFPLTRLLSGTSPVRHSLVSNSFVTHMDLSIPPESAGSEKSS